MHCARRVAHMESYVGLVEVGVGLIPGGGGLTYIARRAAEMASAGNANADIFAFLKDGFTNAAMAKVATSALVRACALASLRWPPSKIACASDGPSDQNRLGADSSLLSVLLR